MTKKLLGELALRVNDLAKMKAFYRDIVGLEIFNDDFEESIHFVFFKIDEGVPGHPTILGLFDRSVETAQQQSTLDHFAFVIDLDDYEPEKQRLEALGIAVLPLTFTPFHWRALFFKDPEDNTIEFVCYDHDVK
jgi:extradiol dioxygenase family protein